MNMYIYIYIHKNSIFKHPLTSTSPSSASSEMVHRTPMPKAFAMKSMSITSTQPVARISSHLEVSRSRSRTLSIVVFMNLRARSSSVFTILWLVEYPEFFRGTVFHTSKSLEHYARNTDPQQVHNALVDHMLHECQMVSAF